MAVKKCRRATFNRPAFETKTQGDPYKLDSGLGWSDVKKRHLAPYIYLIIIETYDF